MLEDGNKQIFAQVRPASLDTRISRIHHVSLPQIIGSGSKGRAGEFKFVSDDLIPCLLFL
jgi:hypothetical protein